MTALSTRGLFESTDPKVYRCSTDALPDYPFTMHDRHVHGPLALATGLYTCPHCGDHPIIPVLSDCRRGGVWGSAQAVSAVSEGEHGLGDTHREVFVILLRTFLNWTPLDHSSSSSQMCLISPLLRLQNASSHGTCLLVLVHLAICHQKTCCHVRLLCSRSSPDSTSCS